MKKSNLANILANSPERIQRKRIKGWKMPENTVYVGRPTKWGNPFKVEKCRTIEQVLQLYQIYLDSELKAGKLNLSELDGKNLACFCPLTKPCHADILLKYIQDAQNSKQL